MHVAPKLSVASRLHDASAAALGISPASLARALAGTAIPLRRLSAGGMAPDLRALRRLLADRAASAAQRIHPQEVHS